MKCPSCNVNLVMTERSGIEIDYCPECRGVWLDRGELDKIIERSATSAPAPPQPASPREAVPYDRGYREEYRPKKKKSLLDDLFDF